MDLSKQVEQLSTTSYSKSRVIWNMTGCYMYSLYFSLATSHAKSSPRSFNCSTNVSVLHIISAVRHPLYELKHSSHAVYYLILGLKVTVYLIPYLFRSNILCYFSVNHCSSQSSVFFQIQLKRTCDISRHVCISKHPCSL